MLVGRVLERSAGLNQMEGCQHIQLEVEDALCKRPKKQMCCTFIFDVTRSSLLYNS
jgi:hypothetical protein